MKHIYLNNENVAHMESETPGWRACWVANANNVFSVPTTEYVAVADVQALIDALGMAIQYMDEAGSTNALSDVRERLEKFEANK